LFAVPCAAETIIVDPNGSANFTTIQAAINDANHGDTIVIADGIYTGSGNRDINFQGKAIAVRSRTGPSNCIIDCAGTQSHPHRGFNFLSNEDGSSVLDGFTIRGGYATGEWPDYSGGGIRCYGASPTIVNCIIIGNSAEGGGGGGISCDDSRGPTIQNCLVSGNNAEYGGGICCYYSSPTITNCSIIGNYGKYGGGVYCGRNAPTISNCNISGNMYDGDFNGSQVHGGGGLFCYYSDMVLNNSVINRNGTNGYGGGILFEGGDQTIINSTITENSAGTSTQVYLQPSGGGIAGHFGGHIEVHNCILWGDQAIGEPENEIFLWTMTSVSTATVSYSNIEGGCPGTGNIRTNPLFVDPINGDYHLLPNSPCIDAGDNSSVPPDTADLDGDGNTTEPIPFDLDNNPRCVDLPSVADTGSGEAPIVDMGAYEAFIPPIEVWMKFTPQSLNPGTNGSWVKAHFVMPEGFSVDDVDANTPVEIEQLGIESHYVNVFINEDGLVCIEAGFDRSEFCKATRGGEVMEITVVGYLIDGRRFSGIDTARILDKTMERLATMASYWLQSGCGAPDWCSDSDINRDSVVNFLDFADVESCCIEVMGD
jgi:parallel beta-helix repeat protein